MLIGPFLLVVGSLLPIVNPLGSAPIFLVMTRGSDEATRHEARVQVAFNSFILLFASMVFGRWCSSCSGCRCPWCRSRAAPCCARWAGTCSTRTSPRQRCRARARRGDDRAGFYPLTLPVTVDPGAIAVAITVGANHAHGVERVVIAIIASILGLGLIAFTVWLAYHYAERVARWLGTPG
jgi:multiple antibiotic resistance protein